MKLKKAGANIQQVCRCLSLTRSVFYARSCRPMLKPNVLMLHAAAKHVHAEIDATYGSRRMCIELRVQGFNVGRYRVRQIMKNLLLVANEEGCAVDVHIHVVIRHFMFGERLSAQSDNVTFGGADVFLDCFSV
ncbi:MULTISPECIES: IS3 family transposase [Serratia]|uniref:IS3 family transposase n=1 Tax=Serratia TaxID=613 RepID=UPI0021B7EB78|nr:MULTISPECIES: IS3 family transposase [Serratia]